MDAASPAPPEIPAPPWHRAHRTAITHRPITRDLIVTTSLRVLDAESLGALSMRRVARELGTGPASLYAHVANKKELLDLMFDRVAGEVELPGPPDGPRWRQQVRELAVAMHAVLSRHSDVARVALASIPTGPNALLLRERLLAILLAGGVPAQAAAWSLDRLALYICADAAGQDLESHGHQQKTGELRDRLAGLPPAHFPVIVAHVDELTSGAGGEHFLFGLDLILDGLAARVPAPPRRHAAR